MSAHRYVPLACAIILALLLAAGAVMPDWALFLITMSLAKGLVVLGVITTMRGGLVSFGQGLYFCIGAYVAGLMANWTGITDIVLLSALAIVAAGGLGMLLGPLLATYRGIFFAMLSLSLSMILYGMLSKTTALGGTDGLNVAAPTFLGYAPDGRPLALTLYGFTCLIAVVVGGALRWIFDSERGLITLAIRDNELRVEYLGASVRAAMTTNYVIAAALGGVGGAIAGLAIGHVDPEFSYWTTSGEFVFVAILAGYLSITAVFISSILLEVVRSFSNISFPHWWQLALGCFLLIVFWLLPDGLGSLSLKRRRSAAPTPSTSVQSEKP